MKLPIRELPPRMTGIKPSNVIGQTVIGRPGVGSTQTFITIGEFDTEQEAINCQKYIATKFARAMLSIKKVTQDNPPAAWEYVLLQDFTAQSDIDWTRPLPEIDKQLYRKYKLNWRERTFIETHFKYREG